MSPPCKKNPYSKYTLTSYFKSSSARSEFHTECETGDSCEAGVSTTPFEMEPALEEQPELACDILPENSTFETCDIGMPSSSESENSDDEDNFLEAPLKNKKFDGRSNKLAFTIKWERVFSWSYYSAAEEGWFCKTCQEYSHNGDEYWKTLPRKHDAHPGVFREHENFKKHKDVVANKKEVKAILSKGNVLKQLQLGMEARTNAERKRKRKFVKKLIKTVYFFFAQKMGCETNF